MPLSEEQNRELYIAISNSYSGKLNQKKTATSPPTREETVSVSYLSPPPPDVTAVRLIIHMMMTSRSRYYRNHVVGLAKDVSEQSFTVFGGQDHPDVYIPVVVHLNVQYQM